MTALDVRPRAQLRIAIARHDRVAELVLLARIYPSPWQPEPEPYLIFTMPLLRSAA